MKKIILILCLTFNVALISQTTQSLKTTMSWVTTKLDYYSSIQYKDPSLEKSMNPLGARSWKSYFNYDTKTLFILHQDYYTDKFDTTEIPFSKLNPCNITIKDVSINDDDPKYVKQKRVCIYLTTTNNSFLIMQNGFMKGQKMGLDNFGIILPEHILNAEPDLAERLKKAFINAIKQCGGKCEAY